MDDESLDFLGLSFRLVNLAQSATMAVGGPAVFMLPLPAIVTSLFNHTAAFSSTLGMGRQLTSPPPVTSN